MSAHIIDSALFADLFGLSEMRAVFNDRNLLQKWLDFEAALATSTLLPVMRVRISSLR
ncbi:MAG: hypothetical protein OXG60_03765 [Chloroflexi bacterium]|nr:hypothetical protein [Chloroflexota bacterium]